MEEYQKEVQMLALMHRAALLVVQGKILYANPAASRFLLQPGMDFTPLLSTGQIEYPDFPNGCMHLTLHQDGFDFAATILRDAQKDIVLLEETGDASPLQALSLAALELRQPLAGASAIADRMFPAMAQNDQLQDYCDQLNRRMLQMQRIIGNMADCQDYGHADERAMEYVEISSFLEELLLGAADALQQAGFQLEWELPEQRIYTLAYPQKLERAVYNLLSNAAKFSPQGGIIRAQLRYSGERLSFSVTDQGPGVNHAGDAFTRYLRQPGIEDPRYGLGLGMVLVRATAALHGGAVLLDQPEGWGARFTITMAIRRKKESQVQSPIMRIDYAGEKDHCLLELSDVLPAQLYRTENLK